MLNLKLKSNMAKVSFYLILEMSMRANFKMVIFMVMGGRFGLTVLGISGIGKMVT